MSDVPDVSKYLMGKIDIYRFPLFEPSTNGVKVNILLQPYKHHSKFGALIQGSKYGS